MNKKVAYELIKIARELIASNHKTIKEITIKDKGTIPAGTPCTIEWKDKHNAGRAAIVINENDIVGWGGNKGLKPIACPTAVLYKYVSGFNKPPSMNTLEKWNNDGVAKTVTGQRIEPDGWSHDGSPSWLLVLGIM